MASRFIYQMLGFAISAFIAAAAGAQVVVDTFEVGQPLLSLSSVPGTVHDHAADDPSILGGERDLRVSGSDITGGNITVQVASGVMTFNRPGTSVGEVNAWWDGLNNTSTFDPTGLGGLDLTQAGATDRFRIAVVSSSSAVLRLRLVVWTTGTAFSERDFTLPTGGGFVDLPFASFTASGGGADFTAVGALYLRTVENTGAWTASLGSIAVTGSLPSVEFVSATFATGEGAVFATIGVNRSGPLTGSSTVQYSTSDNTAVAGSDYTVTSGTLTFDPGEGADSFNVPLTQDGVDEPNELINLTLSAPTGAILGVPVAATLQILDDDGPPAISVANVAQAEGDAGTTAFTFSATLSSPSGFPVSFDYATADGSAVSPGDYAAVAATTLTIPAGSPGGSLNVTVAGDTNVEANETFVVNLSAPVNATLANSQATATILNDDALAVTEIPAASPLTLALLFGALALAALRRLR